MKLCTIEADLSRVPILPQPKLTGKGSFYRVRYDIILLFGMTELKAQIAWMEKVSSLFKLYISFNLLIRYWINFMRGFYREKKNGKLFF